MIVMTTSELISKLKYVNSSINTDKASNSGAEIKHLENPSLTALFAKLPFICYPHLISKKTKVSI